MTDISKIKYQIDCGVVGVELFRLMKEAEEYGAASSLPWLQSVLVKIHDRLSLGKSIRLNSDRTFFDINSPAEFNYFFEREFPTAFRLCIPFNK